jgi:hypothetical protein
MPNIEVKFRRGTATEHSSFTGAEGEVTVDTTNDTLRVHDGSTAGGVRLAKHSELGGLADGSVTTAKIADDAVTNAKIGLGAVGSTEIADSAVTTAKIGLRAVTFEKVQLVGNMTVLGNVTGATASPSSVTILDEDAMGTNSATALATQQSIKAYVDSQVSAGTVSKWDSGWVSQDDQSTPVSVGNGATMVFDHDLGSAAVGSVFSVYGAEDSSGTDMEQQNYLHWVEGTSFARGAQVKSITPTNITVQLAPNAYTVSNSGAFSSKNWGTGTNFFSHIRVVLVG